MKGHGCISQNVDLENGWLTLSSKEFKMSGTSYSTQSWLLQNGMCNVTVCVDSCIDIATNSALTSVHFVFLRKTANNTTWSSNLCTTHFITNHALISTPTCFGIYWCHIQRVQSTLQMCWEENYSAVNSLKMTSVHAKQVRVKISVWFGTQCVVHNTWLIKRCYGTQCTVRMILQKSRIILPLKEVRRFHVYVVWYDICMVRCIA